MQLFAYSWKLPAYSRAFLLRVVFGSFFSLTARAFSLKVGALLLTIEAFLLTVAKCF